MVTLCTTCTMCFFFNYDEAACPLGVIYIVAHTFQSILGISCRLYHVFIWIIFMESDNLRQSDFLSHIQCSHPRVPRGFIHQQTAYAGSCTSTHICGRRTLCAHVNQRQALLTSWPCDPVWMVLVWEFYDNYKYFVSSLHYLWLVTIGFTVLKPPCHQLLIEQKTI